MKKHFLIGLMLLATGFGACNKAIDGGTTSPGKGGGGSGIAPGGCFPRTDCAGVMCTAMFATVGLEVRDAAGAPIALDAFVVTDASGNPLPMNNGQAVYGYPNNGDGNYTVINDAWVQGHQNTNMTVHAKGYIKGSEVFNLPFGVGADCCHVNKISGQDFVTITTQR